MGLDYIPHQGRSFLGVTKSFVASGARSNKQTKDPFIVIQLTTPTVIINIIFGESQGQLWLEKVVTSFMDSGLL